MKPAARRASGRSIAGYSCTQIAVRSLTLFMSADEEENLEQADRPLIARVEAKARKKRTVVGIGAARVGASFARTRPTTRSASRVVTAM